MKKNKLFLLILAAIIILSLAVSCVPAQYKKLGGSDNSSDDMIKNAIAEKIKRDADQPPPTIVMVFGTLIPITGSIGFFLVIFFALSQHFKKVNHMIEKGIYQPKQRKIRWDLVFIFMGTILILTGLGVSLCMIGYYGIHTWSLVTGIIPVFLGAAFVILYLIFKKELK